MAEAEVVKEENNGRYILLFRPWNREEALTSQLETPPTAPPFNLNGL